MFNDNTTNEPIIQVPAFNGRYYTNGRPISIKKKDKPPFSAIIVGTNHQIMNVVYVDGGSVKEEAIDLFDVIEGKLEIK